MIGSALCQAQSWELAIQFLSRYFRQFCDLRLVFRPLQRQRRPRDRRHLPEATQQRGPLPASAAGWWPARSGEEHARRLLTFPSLSFQHLSINHPDTR